MKDFIWIFCQLNSGCSLRSLGFAAFFYGFHSSSMSYRKDENSNVSRSLCTKLFASRMAVAISYCFRRKGGSRNVISC